MNSKAGRSKKASTIKKVAFLRWRSFRTFSTVAAKKLLSGSNKCPWLNKYVLLKKKSPPKAFAGEKSHQMQSFKLRISRSRLPQEKPIYVV
jgi:hypothetical protein